MNAPHNTDYLTTTEIGRFRHKSRSLLGVLVLLVAIAVTGLVATGSGDGNAGEITASPGIQAARKAAETNTPGGKTAGGPAIGAKKASEPSVKTPGGDPSTTTSSAAALSATGAATAPPVKSSSAMSPPPHRESKHDKTPGAHTDHRWHQTPEHLSPNHHGAASDHRGADPTGKPWRLGAKRAGLLCFTQRQ